MQVTEVSNNGLKREYKVVLPAADLASRLDGQLSELKGKVRINGFRPGKVPMAHLKRLYGRQVMGDVVQGAVDEANRKIVEENGLRLALAPKIDLAGDQAELEQAMEARGDFAFTVAVETLPKFETGSFDTLELERPVAAIDDAEVGKAVDRLADQNRTYTPREGDEAVAADGDRVTVDFEGTIDGEVFEGGAGTDIDVAIGSNTFIPGFEEQLKGVKVGDQPTVEATFPENYGSAALAGKTARFAVTVKAVQAPGAVTIDDEFAKTFGFDDLSKLQDAVRGRMGDELGKASRDKLKRRLLDALDKRYSFELPEGLVNQEFANIWRQVTAEQSRGKRTFEDEGTTEEAAQADYRRIAERRVRLGLVLAEVGEAAQVKVDDNEVTKSLVDLTRQFPGQEQQVWDYYRKNPQALAELKAPLFEEKVVDHIIAQAKVTDVTVSREDLFKPEGDELEAALDRIEPAAPELGEAEEGTVADDTGSAPESQRQEG